jgi:hypothetical protein
MDTRAGYLLVSCMRELAYNWHRGDVALINTGILIVYLDRRSKLLTADTWDILRGWRCEAKTTLLVYASTYMVASIPRQKKVRV